MVELKVEFWGHVTGTMQFWSRRTLPPGQMQRPVESGEDSPGQFEMQVLASLR